MPLKAYPVFLPFFQIQARLPKLASKDLGKVTNKISYYEIFSTKKDMFGYCFILLI